MRVLFLTRGYGPDSNASGQLLAELCEGLAERHVVTVIAGPDTTAAGPSRPGLWRREHMAGVEVLRTWGTRFGKRSLPGRLLNLATYFLFAFVATFRIERHDVVVTLTDPPLLGVVGGLLRRRWGCRFVYYCHDLFPDVGEAIGTLRKGFLAWTLRRGNAYAFRRTDRILALGEAMRDRIARKGVDPERIVVLPNWSDVHTVVPIESSPFRERFGDRFVVMHSGNMGLMQGLDVLLDAAKRLREEADIVFALIGAGVSRASLERRVAKEAIDNVEFMPFQPRSELAASLSAADLHIVALRSGVDGCLLPSKVYGVMAAGRPFVAVMDEDAEVAQLARKHQIGFTVRAGDAEGLAHAILEARDRSDERHAMGQRARALAEAEYNVERSVQRFDDVLKDLG